MDGLEKLISLLLIVSVYFGDIGVSLESLGNPHSKLKLLYEVICTQ